MTIPADFAERSAAWFASEAAEVALAAAGESYDDFAKRHGLNLQSVSTQEKWIRYRWLAERVMFDWLPNMGSER